MTDTPIRIAVVGSGPAGFYAAGHLLKDPSERFEVDMIERLPTPWGLVRSGVARQVTVDRGATRFCPNMREHCHFYCDTCAKVFDIELSDESPSGITLPKGFKATRFEIAIHGLCAKCAAHGK